jgi:hypothetical protein
MELKNVTSNNKTEKWRFLKIQIKQKKKKNKKMGDG